ncbi:MAG TPA: flagellar hook assembly protein FlgD [Devosiaceae bacterium]|jgi:flagellar basal-body rod modification protein FlgD|nr:flagellar hook assembly protein FlgD [Devosiaceae bacterium]
MAISGIGGGMGTSALSGTRQGIADNFDTFLQLLTTQLKNQNPLDPLDTNQFTQQLVQFTGVEQQLKTNEFLEAMMLANQNAGSSQAVGYIGKVVTASGSRSELVDGQAQWRFATAKAAEITATVRDKDGNVVFTHQGSVGQGESIFTWDGIGSSGRRQPDGPYSITIEGRDSEGKLVNVATEMTGEVTGVDLTGSEPVLIVGTARVNMSSVMSIRAKTAAEAGV